MSFPIESLEQVQNFLNQQKQLNEKQNREIDNLRNKLQNFAPSFNTQNVNEDTTRLRRQCEHLENLLDESLSLQKQNEIELNEKENEIYKLRQLVEEFKYKQSLHSVDLGSLKEIISNKDMELSEARGKIQELSQQLLSQSTVDQNISLLKEMIKETGSELNGARSEIRKLHELTRTKDQTISNLQEQLEENEKKLEEANNRISHLTQKSPQNGGQSLQNVQTKRKQIQNSRPIQRVPVESGLFPSLFIDMISNFFNC